MLEIQVGRVDAGPHEPREHALELVRGQTAGAQKTFAACAIIEFIGIPAEAMRER